MTLIHEDLYAICLLYLTKFREVSSEGDHYSWEVFESPEICLSSGKASWKTWKFDKSSGIWLYIFKVFIYFDLFLWRSSSDYEIQINIIWTTMKYISRLLLIDMKRLFEKKIDKIVVFILTVWVVVSVVVVVVYYCLFVWLFVS